MSDPTSMPRKRTLLSDEMAAWLEAAGIIPSRTRRVVIELVAREPVRVYIEQFGTEGLISVEPPPELRGAEITIDGQRVDAEGVLGR